tara:strand:+ start:151 stop:813 length:663 start_codon:yes stop_codon:yes gene_type:complete
MISLSRNNDIKAVFFDFGGVITQSPFENFNQFEKENNLPINFIRRVNSVNPDNNAWALLEKNQISTAEFDKIFADESEKVGHKISGRQVLELLDLKVRPEMIEIVRNCRKDFKVACLTNNIKNQSSDCPSNIKNEYYKVLLTEFDFVVESSKIGFRKPEFDFYKYACDLIKVAPKQVVFLDDLGVNLKPARQLGMYTIKVEKPEKAIIDLKTVLWPTNIV